MTATAGLAERVGAGAEIVACNVIAARGALGLSQQQLADRARLSRATINMIENGACDPRLSTLEALAAALSTSPVLLMLRPAELAAIEECRTGSKALRATIDRAMDRERANSIEHLRSSPLPRARGQAVDLAAKTATGAGLASSGVVGGAIGAMLGGPVGFALGATLGLLLSPAPSNAGAQRARVDNRSAWAKRRTPPR